MRILGGILPFIGFTARFVNEQGQCLESRDDAVITVQNGDPVVLIEVFEVSWLNRYLWPWRAHDAFLITDYGVRDGSGS